MQKIHIATIFFTTTKLNIENCSTFKQAHVGSQTHLTEAKLERKQNLNNQNSKTD